jgi:Peptidase family M1 domain
MRALAPLALVALARAGWADPLPAQASAVADYDIRVRLDAEARTLSGDERITWRNLGDEPVGELWFHLYLNAFRNSESTFYRESGGQLRGDRMPDEGWGWVEVKSLRREDGTDLLPGASFEQPDDDNAADQTLWRVPLAQPVPAGGAIVLELAFEAKLPRVFARTGYFRDYFLVGQWFPKLAAYEPPGTRGRDRGGWNRHQFHANSEFYSDFGRYRVEIMLPRRFVVGATGKRAARREHPDGSATHVFEQADVIDFAWTASPRFVEVKARFSADSDVTAQEYADAASLLGRSLDEVRLSDVDVSLLLQPEHLPQAERQLRAAKAALKWFGLWYGRYPYPTLTIVDPAFGAGGSGGMEYPTFITGLTSVLFNRGPLARVLIPEEVIVHEFGHQYWQSMVASNEFEESWLDEGFASYSTGRVMETVYGPWMAQAFGLRVGGLAMSRMSNSVERMFDRVRSPAWGFSSSGNYGFNSYARTQLTLLTLESLIGPETMARAMRTYHERFRFRHPGSDDFYAVVSEVAGRDMSGFFAQTVERPGILDYEVSSVTSERIAEPRGVFGEGASRTIVTADAARAKEKSADEGAGRRWRSAVTVRRRGEVVLPTSLRLEYEGGAVQTITLAERDDTRAGVERLELPGGAQGAEPWRSRFKRLELTSEERLVSAGVDPDDRLKLDVNRLNNARRSAPDSKAASLWGARLVFWLQQLLGLAGL